MLNKKISAEELVRIRDDYTKYGLIFDNDTLYNPLFDIPADLQEKPHLFYAWLLSRPEYTSFICSEVLNVNLLPFQAVIIQELWQRKFPMLVGSRGAGKSFLLAVYIMLRMLLLPNRKIVVAGASFRQSKLIYEYCIRIWNDSPMLRDSVASCPGHQGPKGGNDAVYFHLGGSRAIFIPVGTGETIRGLRANDIITDEFKSHNKEIFENVISGFGAVEDSPQDKVALRLEKEFNELFGIESTERADDQDISNQIVISGTAYYYFNHFAEYWTKWRNIVLSKGDPAKLYNLFPDGIDEAFDWKDYSIIRLPYNFLPKGYMDSGNIARSKATLHKSLFDMEFGAVFSKDSDGFFKATLVESCVAFLKNRIEKLEGIINYFPKLSGDPDKKYYMGVDTASQVDNFAIVIIEAYKDHRRIVYCWTTNTKAFKEAKKTKAIEETDFFRYCSRKIRTLMQRFSIETIAIDSQGGGRTIYESLHDKNSLKPGEQMIWEKIIPGTINDTDSEEGLHIVEMVNFAKQEYMSNSNHGLKKDFEDKKCLFPEYNPAILATYANMSSDYAQEMEDCIEDIEELKKELTQIVVTTTANGRERFDTPEVKLSGSEKTRARKDRYSALLMANMSCRTDYHQENDYNASSIAQMSNNSMQKEEVAFIGPAWVVEGYKDLYD